MNMCSGHGQFKDAMRAAGITPPAEIVQDGKLRRFHNEGDKRGSTNGWYVLYDDPPAGSFGDWKQGISETWSGKEYQSLTPAEKAAHRRNMESAKAARQAEQERIHTEARRRAAEIWHGAEPASADHPYLVEKGVSPHELKQSRGALVVPLYQGDTLQGLQFIDAGGNKKFLSGTAKRGSYFVIGGKPESVLYLAEGFATAASVHEATGAPCVVCFDAGNLRPVAEKMREAYPYLNIILCADNDRSGVGQKAAREAAGVIGATVAIPPQTGEDFNDMASRAGLEAVRQCLEPKPPAIFADVADLLLDPVEPKFLVDGVIEERTTGALFGESTAGKSFIAVGMAGCCATGTPWADHEITKPGPVFYFAGEGRQGIPRRIAAWQEHSGVTIPRGRIFLPKQRIVFDATGARLVAGAVAELAEKHGDPALLVIDTLARSLPSGSDENSAQDMMAFINEVDALRDRFGCVALIVHHTGHGEEARNRARGSSTFRAAMDFEMLADKRKNRISFTKMKDAEAPDPIAFKLESVGPSAVAVFDGPVQDKGPDLTKAENFALSTLRDTLERVGRRWAHVDEWRVDFYRRHHADTSATKRKAFSRVRADLVGKGLLILDSDTYALAGQAGQSETMSREVTGQTGHTPLGVSRCPASVSRPDELVEVEI